MEIKTDLINVLNEVAVNQNWKNFDVQTNFETEKGKGFFGEFFMGSIKNKDTGEKLNLAIKKAFNTKSRREQMPMRKAFLNEIYFYTNILPAWEQFLSEKGQQEMLNMLGKHYLSINKEFHETVVMENLKERGYDILEREALLDDELMKLIFKTYGKFHAVSFAFKDQQPKEYKTFVGKINDIFVNIDELKSFIYSLTDVSNECFNNLNEKNKIECKNLFENPGEMYKKTLIYEDKSSCLLHGDCWSNNMMFKYNNNTLEGIKLIDFQVIREGTPVYDLSYFFYAGATKELYNNLDKYLELYYETFSQTVSLLGSDANQLMSLDNLKEDWKKYFKFGFFMALLILKFKVASSEDVKLMADENGEDLMKSLENANIDNSLYKERINDLVEHLCTNKFV